MSTDAESWREHAAYLRSAAKLTADPKLRIELVRLAEHAMTMASQAGSVDPAASGGTRTH
ncbi:MAG: hypothetical protein FJX64_08825 [Alphaproteobacteria bacterium]|nr:hypothetical protein [Alphaproteobacteria bacterium]